VLGMLELVLLEELPDELHGYLETVQNSSQALLRILNDILDFSRIEAGIMSFVEEPFSLPESVQGAVELFVPDARRKGLKLSLEIASTTPQRVRGDEGRVRQILINLIGNALKFTGEGTVSIRVEAGTTAGNGCHEVIFTVTDTGIGIAKDKHGSIFDPFSQADASLTRRYGGTGLGLTICREVAEKMGGSVTFSSVEGSGSVFVVSLPLREAGDDVSVPEGEEDETGSPAAASKGKELRILAAEDDPTISNFLGIVFQRWNLKADFAGNGEDAVSLWRNGNYDLILMDGQMPRMDGIEATRAIRAREKEQGGHIPIVALTANAFSSDRDKYLGAGMDDYVAKPIRIKNLLEVIKKQIGGKWKD